MPTLRVKHNFRTNVINEETRGLTVDVRLKNDEYRPVLWLGSIEREIAKISPNTRPVKLRATSYTVSDEWGEWIDLKRGEHLMGCLSTGEGVYMVVEQGWPVLVRVQKCQSLSKRSGCSVHLLYVVSVSNGYTLNCEFSHKSICLHPIPDYLYCYQFN